MSVWKFTADLPSIQVALQEKYSSLAENVPRPLFLPIVCLTPY